LQNIHEKKKQILSPQEGVKVGSNEKNS